MKTHDFYLHVRKVVLSALKAEDFTRIDESRDHSPLFLLRVLLLVVDRTEQLSPETLLLLLMEDRSVLLLVARLVQRLRLLLLLLIAINIEEHLTAL